MREAKIDDTEHGRVPVDGGWHILNLAEMQWATVEGGGTKAAWSAALAK